MDSLYLPESSFHWDQFSYLCVERWETGAWFRVAQLISVDGAELSGPDSHQMRPDYARLHNEYFTEINHGWTQEPFCWFHRKDREAENLGRFWLTVYNLRANGGSRNIIAFSYAGCCLYQMEMRLYRVWDQIYSIWIWLLRPTFKLRSSTPDWQDEVAVYVMQVCVWISLSGHVFAYVCVSVSGGRQRCSQQHAAAGRPPLFPPWGEQLLHKHVGVWAMSLWFPSSPSLLLFHTHQHSASDINPLHFLYF